MRESSSRAQSYSGNSRYELVSNPFRAYNDSTMGWTLTQFDQMNRPIAVTTWNGSAKPSPFGGNSAPTGTVTTSYSEQTTEVTDQNSVSRTSALNGLGRLSSVTENGTGLTTSYDYDALDDLTAVRDITGYDALGRITGVSQTIGTGSPQTVTQQWYADGQLKQETLPSTRELDYTQDGAGRASSVKASTNSYPYATVTAYSPQGAVATMAMGNPSSPTLTETTTFNSRLQPLSISAGSLTLHMYYCQALQLVCASGDNGNLVEQDITALGSSYKQTYLYDGVNRLCAAVEGAGAIAPSCATTSAPLGSNWWQTYVYDALGNRALIAGGYGTAGNAQAQVASPGSALPYDSHNRWPGGAPYDGSGNEGTVTAGTTAASYDAENRLTSVTENSMPSIAYLYDGEGRRVQKTVGSVVTQYVYDGQGDLVGEYGGNEPVPASTVYVTADWLGSTRMETDASNGTAVELRDYAPFGEELPTGVGTRGSLYGSAGYPSATANVMASEFTGKERDAESGLDWFKTRYLSSAQGRFISPDPLGAAAGKEGDPQSWNLYTYSRNNPLPYTDPDGLTFRICDTNGNCDDNYSDANFYKNLDKTSKKGIIYDNNGIKIGTYERTSFDDLGPLGNSLYFGMAQRRQASNQFIGAFAAASVVAGTGVGIGLQATGGAGLTTLDSTAPYLRYTPGQLNQLIGGAQRELLKDLFGQEEQGAASRLANFRLPEGLTRETLEIYKEAAERVVQRGPGAPGFEVQKLRLDIVEKALSLLKK